MTPTATGPRQAFLSTWAAERPDRPAVVMTGTGETLTYRQLDERSNRFAHALRAAGATRGTHIAYLLDNSPRVFEVAWGAYRAGCYYTPVNTRFTADEVAYVVRDSGAAVLVASARFRDVAEQVAERVPGLRLSLATGGDIDGYESYDEVLRRFPATPVADESPGCRMLYSSGTTGAPKGVKRPLPSGSLGATDPWLTTQARLYGWTGDTRYLCPAPLYHGAGLWWTTAMHRLGATAYVMEKFDARAFLETVQRHRITSTQLVPTMFVRLLRLPEDTRRGFDVSSLTSAIHAAAPCPVEVKEAMIDWWGPIVFEYFAATEGNGSTSITTGEWLRHKGSVGKAVVGIPHVVGADGTELPPGEVGLVYFESTTGEVFEYHNDPDKTRAARLGSWSTTGDMGYLDSEGYLYLTDRSSHMIISGGVNIYPQEAENVLATHEAVDDVAVIGVPDPEFGEQVKAVVVPRPGVAAGPDLEAALVAWCRDRLAHYKCPKSVDFVDALPRGDNGKLYKLRLREAYWEGHSSVIR
ncbi:acyl-CoA synthetase [Amycolatopsis thermophila]|uniref:Acyl-CoA synthetase (AMP-forming)/AMP-acid ligase II n=1 Tax=Amycolatopsis thermophila TaxID=206084 RepID=A0ABU0F5F6_9PSEU|nr:acyl-CoA synthetase [Amycolatopsis thermophila]MDQ0382817.1 acyl-CoA synthetase (AMP-forming)/AMP-acid ligase II [Amycolatopsis thermophila]